MEAVSIDLNAFRLAAVICFSLAVISALYVYDQLAKQHFAAKAKLAKANVINYKALVVVHNIHKAQPLKKERTSLKLAA